MDLDKILAVTFSGVRPGEEPAVTDLLDDCQLLTEDLTSEMMRNNFLVARKGGRIIGVIGLEPCGPQEALLRSLAVAKDFRRQHLASRLTDFIARHAFSLGIRKIYLLTMSARDFFAKQGFLEIARAQAPPAVQSTREFKEMCPDSAVCMYRSLAEFRSP